MKKDFKMIVDRYSSDKSLKAYAGYAKHGLWESEKILFKKHIKETNRILDLGCGTGRTTIGLFKMGYKNIIGLDITPDFIQIAQSLSRENGFAIDFLKGNACALPFEDKCFDVVIFSYSGLMCIPKLSNRKKALSEISRVLKTGGLFIFSSGDREDEEEIEKFGELWAKRKKIFEKGEQDKNLEMFGDIWFQNDSGSGFLHIPSFSEIKDFVSTEPFEIIFSEMRRKICIVPKYEQENFTECRFYILKKVGQKT